MSSFLSAALLGTLLVTGQDGVDRALVERLGQPDRTAAAVAVSRLVDLDRDGLEALARFAHQAPAPRLALVVAALAAEPRELGQLLLPLLDAQDADVRAGALALLVGTRSWRALALAQRHASDRVRALAAKGLRGHVADVEALLVAELAALDGRRLERAFAFVAMLGADGAEVLASLLCDEAWFVRVSTALRSFGTPGYVALLRRWSAMSEAQRLRVAAQLANRPDRTRRILRGVARFGPIDAAVVATDRLAAANDATTLRELLSVGRLQVRLRALGHLAAAGEESIPVLTEALRDRDPGLRREVLHRLLALGPPATEPIADLVDGGTPGLRLEAVRGLLAAGVPGVRALAAAREHHGEAPLRALRPALRRLLPDLTPDLAVALRSGDPVAVPFAATLAAELGAFDLLVELRLELDGVEVASGIVAPRPAPEPQHSTGTDDALATCLDDRLRAAGAAAVPPLLRALGRGDSHRRGPCLDLMRRLGPAAVPGLVHALEDQALRDAAGSVLDALDLGVPAGPGR
ncbi:MAG: hypothetical protein R3F30_12220 [Planctomycetota bacterium]